MFEVKKKAYLFFIAFFAFYSMSTFAQNISGQLDSINLLLQQNLIEEAHQKCEEEMENSIRSFEETNDKKHLNSAFYFSEKSRMIESIRVSPERIKSTKFFSPNISEIQSWLRDTQAIISYHEGDSALYIFKILKNDLELVKKEGNLELAYWVNELFGNMHGYFTSTKQDFNLHKKTGALYAQAAYELYAQLILPLKNLPKDLLIIPSGTLRYIPFDALLTQSVRSPWDWKEHPYLMRKHTISYAYSATSLAQMSANNESDNQSGFFGFAPTYSKKSIQDLDKESSRGILDSLRFNVQEIDTISKNFDGKLLTGKEANRTNFLDGIRNNSLIHLTNYGFLDDTNPNASYWTFGLPNEDEKIRISAFSNEKINADLLTMTSNEVGVDSLEKGQALLYLNQVFSQSGVRSFITSFWSVNDKKRTELMALFYENLKSGMAKDKALRKAKLDYLNQNEVYSCHPYFWSGIIPIGDMRAIEIRPEKSGYAIYLGGVILILILFLVVRKFNSK